MLGVIMVGTIAIVVIFVTPLLLANSAPAIEAEKHKHDKEGWTFVVETPAGYVYKKRLESEHITLYYTSGRYGSVSVVKDEGAK